MEAKDERTMRILSRVVILILALLVIASTDCTNAPESRDRERAKAEQESVRRTISQLAVTHNAVVNWRQALAAKGPVGRIYGAELAPALIRTDGRPLLFIADVADVGPSGRGYVCSFQADANLNWKLKLALECTTDQATQIIRGSSGKYAVVARISSLGSAELTTGGGEAETAGGKFPASGKCLGLVFVGKDYFDDFLEILSFPEQGQR
jgi:hypothetical protein